MKKEAKIKIALLILNLVLLVASIVKTNHLFIMMFSVSLVYLFWLFRRTKIIGRKKNFVLKATMSTNIVLFLIMILFIRLYKVQIVDNEKYNNLIKRQIEKVYTFRGKRGSIYDRQGREIAYDIHVYDIIIDPYMLSQTKKTKEIINELFETLSINKNENKFVDELEKDAKNKRRYKLLGVELTNDEKVKVDDIRKKYSLRNNEIILKEDTKRIYPRGEIYQNIVGIMGYEQESSEFVGVNGIEKQYEDYEIILKEDTKRIYPRGEIYQNIVGIMGYEQESSEFVGVNGIEKQYEDYLKGKILKKRVSSVKSRNFALPTAKEDFDISSDGKDVYLTLEEDLQYILNDEIKKQFDETDSEEAYGIIVNPNSGEVLAIATFKKNKKVVRNPIFQNQLEPGSIFKPIVVAGALEDGYINEDSTFDVKNGRITKHRHTIKEASWSVKGVMSVKDILAKSSNVGMVLISDEFEDNVMSGYLKKFGFYDKTEIDFPYEKVPYHTPSRKWDGLKKNTIAFGQGIVVTPIQMVMAFSSLVNGGVLYKPYLMEKIVDSSNGTVIKRNTPKVVRHTISKETSEKMKDMLEQVVVSGGGARAKVSGYRIGGKTGTAQISAGRGGYLKDDYLTSFIGCFPADNPGGGARAKVSGYRIGGKTGTAQISAGRGGYLKDDYLTSFIGCFPADNPKYVGLIMFYKPRNVERKLGGLIAAPVFSNVIKRLTITREIVADDISKIKITESEIENINLKTTKTKIYIMPDIKGKTMREVVDIFSGNQVKLNIKGTGKVKEFYPLKTTKTKIYIMPDIKGKTMREVVDIFSGNQVKLNIKGTGKVKEFYPAPGTELLEVNEIKIILE